MNIRKARWTYRTFLRALIIFMAASITAECWAAAENAGAVPVQVNGDEVNYFDAEKKVVGTGHVVVTYKDIKMTCNKVTAFVESKEAIAEGNVVVTRGTDTLTGEKITYNFEKETGQITDGAVRTDVWYGKGSQIRRLGPNEIDVENGYITTCDLDKPHYRIRSRQVKIFLDKRVVAKNVTFDVGGVPVFYMPVYNQSMKDKFPKVSAIPGHDKKWGTYLLSSYRYNISEEIKGNINLDYRQLKGLAEGADLRYKNTILGAGYLRTYYMNENDKITDTERERWRVQYRHKWDVLPNTVGVVEVHKFTDKELIKDYFYREFERDPQPETYISLVNTQPNFSTSLLVSKRVNNFFTGVERLPEAALDIRNQQLLEKMPLFYKASFNLVGLDKQFADLTPPRNVVRADTYNQISLPFRVMEFLSVDPYAGTRQTFYTRGAETDQSRFRGAFDSGVDLSTNFYKIYDYKTDFMKLNIDGVRHIFTPNLSYFYKQKPTLLPGRIYDFDDVDTVDKRSGVGLAFENKLQTKRINEKNESYTSELARLIIETDYIFRSSQFTDRLANISTDLELTPYTWLFMKQTALYDPKVNDVRAVNTDVSARDPKDDWRVGIGHRYEQKASSQVTGEVETRLMPKWKCRVYERYEFKGHEFKEQEYSVTRDLHCWEAEFTYSVRDVHTLWVIFRLKAFPEAPVKLGTSYYKPKTGQYTE